MTHNELNRIARDVEELKAELARALDCARINRAFAKTSASNSPAFFRRQARAAIAGGKRARSTLTLRWNALLYYANRPELIS
jgi:hypothetical protein